MASLCCSALEIFQKCFLEIGEHKAKELISAISDLNHGCSLLFQNSCLREAFRNILPLLYVIAVIVFWVHNQVRRFINTFFFSKHVAVTMSIVVRKES